MPSDRRRNCTCCGQHDSIVGPISWRGNCRRCGQMLMVEQIVGNATKTGPAHARRLRGYAKMLERAALDAQRANA
jgi:tRNA G26 N,N-dimethylase Trm1